MHVAGARDTEVRDTEVRDTEVRDTEVRDTEAECVGWDGGDGAAGDAAGDEPGAGRPLHRGRWPPDDSDS
jgi:hypothetical protein